MLALLLASSKGDARELVGVLVGVLVTGVGGVIIIVASSCFLIVKGDCDGVSEAPQTPFSVGKLEASAFLEGFSIGESLQPVLGRSSVFKGVVVSLGLRSNQGALPSLLLPKSPLSRGVSPACGGELEGEA